MSDPFYILMSTRNMLSNLHFNMQPIMVSYLRNNYFSFFQPSLNNAGSLSNTQNSPISAPIQLETTKIEAKTQIYTTNVNTSISYNGNYKELYFSMGLDKEGLNPDVFEMAMEGYNNLSSKYKTNNYLGIFDTTQTADKERYYLIDVKNKKIIGRSVLKTGSGNMNNIKRANVSGSNATLSGFEQVGEEYYSSSMKKSAMRLDGLEQGINNNSRNKGTVVHYTTAKHTKGCKGFSPVYKNGKVDIAATNEKMHMLFPKGTIIFTYPTDPNYRQLSSLC